MNFLVLGLRNLLRNRRRSVMTLLAIALGFAAIATFAGYVHNVYRGLTRQAIQGELLGHLTIMKRGLEIEGALDPQKYLLSKSDVESIDRLLRQDPRTLLVTPRLALSGIVSNGRASTIFIAEGLIPADMRRLQIDVDRDSAARLDDSRATAVAVADGLAQILKLELNRSAIVLVSTLHGQANALDVEVRNIFNTGNSATNDKFMYMPLDLSQKLYDAGGSAARLIVLLDDLANAGEARRRFAAQLAAAGFDVEIKTWEELSVFYRQVKSLFDMIFAFIFSIVLIVVAMSVVNSMSSTVVERTREIGTLRAMGLRRSRVIKLFAIESMLLVTLGCAVGLALTVSILHGVNAAGISYQPPNSSNMVKLLVDFDTEKVAITFVVMCALGVVAALLPARKAAHQPIVQSLGHL